MARRERPSHARGQVPDRAVAVHGAPDRRVRRPQHGECVSAEADEVPLVLHAGNPPTGKREWRSDRNPDDEPRNPPGRIEGCETKTPDQIPGPHMRDEAKQHRRHDGNRQCDQVLEARIAVGDQELPRRENWKYQRYGNAHIRERQADQALQAPDGVAQPEEVPVIDNQKSVEERQGAKEERHDGESDDRRRKDPQDCAT